MRYICLKCFSMVLLVRKNGIVLNIDNVLIIVVESQMGDADSEDEDESDEEETPVKKVVPHFYYKILLSVIILL